MKTLDEMYKDIPIGKQNAVSRQELMAAWGVSDRMVRSKIAAMRREDNGDNYAIISTCNGRGYYKTDNIKDILAFKKETTARGKQTFNALRKINRILQTNSNQMELVSVNRLKDARKAAGIQAKEVVEIVRKYDPLFDKSIMSRIENGRCAPTSLQLSIMADLYGKTPAELTGMEIVAYEAL